MRRYLLGSGDVSPIVVASPYTCGLSAPPELGSPSWPFRSSPEPSRVPSGPEKNSVWTLIDIDFLKSQKQAKNSNWHCALG